MNRLRQLREQNHLSLQDLQDQLLEKEKIKLGRASLNNYERGTQTPKKETWEKIAKFFGVDVAYLMGLSDFPNPKQTTRNNIREYRTQKNMTLQELSELTSISEEMLDEFESGERPILNSSTWLIIANALNIPVSFLTDQEKENLKMKMDETSRQLECLRQKEKVLQHLVNLKSDYFSDTDSTTLQKLNLKVSEGGEVQSYVPVAELRQQIEDLKKENQDLKETIASIAMFADEALKNS